MNSQIKVELQNVYGSDRLIAEAAWTSSSDFNQKNLKTHDQVKTLINMLAREKHSVPFESVIFRFWLRLPIAIDRQLMTHRIASHSGMSGRYRTMPSDYYHIPEDIKEILDKCLIAEYIESKYNTLCTQSNEFYNTTLIELKQYREKNIISPQEYKRAREVIRGVLPQHNMTERVTIMNLRSWCNFYKLRNQSTGAQKEIQFIAESMKNSIIDSNACNLAMQALEENNWSI